MWAVYEGVGRLNSKSEAYRWGCPCMARRTRWSLCSASNMFCRSVFNGFWGDTMNQNSSKRNCSQRVRPICRCALCMGLNDPPYMAVVVSFFSVNGGIVGTSIWRG